MILPCCPGWAWDYAVPAAASQRGGIGHLWPEPCSVLFSEKSSCHFSQWDRFPTICSHGIQHGSSCCNNWPFKQHPASPPSVKLNSCMLCLVYFRALSGAHNVTGTHYPCIEQRRKWKSESCGHCVGTWKVRNHMNIWDLSLGGGEHQWLAKRVMLFHSPFTLEVHLCHCVLISKGKGLRGESREMQEGP